MGVVFFFVLSGFSMTLGYHERVVSPEFDYKQYLTRRAIKIYPLHWLTLLANIPLTLMSTLHWWLIPLFFVNAALLQTYVPIYNVYFSFNAVSWFIADILFFAIVFPFLFRKIACMNQKQRGLMMMIGLVVYSVIALVSFHLPDDVMKGIIYISPFVRLFDFVFGIFLGLEFLSIKEKKYSIKITKLGGAILIMVLVFIGLLIAESIVLSEKASLLAPLYWPLTAILIIVAALPDSIMLLESRLLLRLGECSFTIFLLHRLVLRYTSKLLTIDSKYIYVLFCLIVTIVLSLFVDKYILNPITQWLTKRKQRSMTVRS